jgi:hypothetical protein
MCATESFIVLRLMPITRRDTGITRIRFAAGESGQSAFLDRLRIYLRLIVLQFCYTRSVTCLLDRMVERDQQTGLRTNSAACGFVTAIRDLAITSNIFDHKTRLASEKHSAFRRLVCTD